ncbi:hypothetical protein J6590_002847 [Homalodisca vitripennis]|nr:hypothetical protein J6590_002847 [Homalodisca vitripennis]
MKAEILAGCISEYPSLLLNIRDNGTGDMVLSHGRLQTKIDITVGIDSSTKAVLHLTLG